MSSAQQQHTKTRQLHACTQQTERERRERACAPSIAREADCRMYAFSLHTGRARLAPGPGPAAVSDSAGLALLVFCGQQAAVESLFACLLLDLLDIIHMIYVSRQHPLSNVRNNRPYHAAGTAGSSHVCRILILVWMRLFAEREKICTTCCCIAGGNINNQHFSCVR